MQYKYLVQIDFYGIEMISGWRESHMTLVESHIGGCSSYCHFNTPLCFVYSFYINKYD